MSLQLACGLPRRRPTPSYIRVYIGYVEKRPAKVGQVWLSWYSVRSLVLCPFATHPHCKISSNSCLRHSSTLVSLSSRRGNFHCSIPLEGPTNWRTSVRAHKRRVASYSASTNSLSVRPSLSRLRVKIPDPLTPPSSPEKGLPQPQRATPAPSPHN